MRWQCEQFIAHPDRVVSQTLCRIAQPGDPLSANEGLSGFVDGANRCGAACEHLNGSEGA